MLKNFHLLGWIGLTLGLGVVSCHFPESSVLAQVNSSSQTIETSSQCTYAQVQFGIWIDKLQDGNVEAFNNLVECGSKSVPSLIKAINHDDETIRIVSIAILGEIGEEAIEAIPVLVNVFGRQSDEEEIAVRCNTYHALKKMREEVLFCRTSPSAGSAFLLRTTTIAYKRENPPVMCNFPVIKDILSWKCPQPSIGDAANSPKPQNATPQNNSPASTSQPEKK